MLNLDISNKIKSVINSLSERERFVITNLFGLNQKEMTLNEISNELGLTTERVRQIKNGALKKLSKTQLSNF